MSGVSYTAHGDKEKPRLLTGAECVTAAREMFGKGFFALGGPEKIAVEQAVFGHVAGNYQAITPESLVAQKAPQPVGFQAPAKGQP
jgi:hypothetical protein